MSEPGFGQKTGDRTENRARLGLENLKRHDNTAFTIKYGGVPMETGKTIFEEIKVAAHELAEMVKSLIHEGNVRRIIIKDEHGHTFVEIPVTVAAVGAMFAPILAAVAALATMVAKFTIVVEKTREAENPPAQPAAGSPGAGSGI